MSRPRHSSNWKDYQVSTRLKLWEASFNVNGKRICHLFLRVSQWWNSNFAKMWRQEFFFFLQSQGWYILWDYIVHWIFILGQLGLDWPEISGVLIYLWGSGKVIFMGFLGAQGDISTQVKFSKFMQLAPKLMFFPGWIFSCFHIADTQGYLVNQWVKRYFSTCILSTNDFKHVSNETHLNENWK